MPWKFTFNGLKIISGEFTLSRGVLPSIATLRILPQDLPSLSVGNMTITDGTTTLTFPNCAADTANIRRVHGSDGWRWHLQVMDRRWKWKGGKITGRYNVRKANGDVIAETQKEPHELMTLLFAAMGESNYFLDAVPLHFYPCVDWNLADPATELLKLCERFGFAICLATNNNVNVVPYGVGVDLPTGGEITGTWRLDRDTLPAKVVVTSGPTAYQSRMELQAVDIDDDNFLKAVDDLSYMPAGGWDNDYPHFFSQVADADRWRAFRGTWRYFRVTGQATGGIIPFGHQLPEVAISQIYPLESTLITSGQDEDGVWGRLPAMIDGVYFTYSELPINSATGTPWNGNFTILGDLGIVILDTPTFYLGTGGIVQDPSLYLTTSCHIRKGDGTDIEHLESEVAVAGGAAKNRVVRFPECFAGITVAQTLPITISAEDPTLDRIEELDAIRDTVKLRYSTVRLCAIEYNAVQDISPDGLIAQVKWRGWCGRAGTTAASTGFEFDPFTLSAAERTRRVMTDGLVEDSYVAAD